MQIIKEIMPNSSLKGRQKHWKTTTTTTKTPDTLIKKKKKKTESTHNPHTSVTTRMPYQTPGKLSGFFFP